MEIGDHLQASFLQRYLLVQPLMRLTVSEGMFGLDVLELAQIQGYLGWSWLTLSELGMVMLLVTSPNLLGEGRNIQMNLLVFLLQIVSDPSYQ